MKKLYVIAGPRVWTDKARFEKVMKNVHSDLIYVGDAKSGIDKMILQWAKENNREIRVFKADWNNPAFKNDKANWAGLERNKLMVEDAVRVKENEGYMLKGLIFIKGPSKGTRNTWMHLKHFGISTVKIEHGITSLNDFIGL